VKTGGTIILDPDMVPNEIGLKSVKVYKVPATKIAEEMGKRIVANIVMLGAFAAITNVLNKEALKKSVLANVPKGTEEINIAAFEKGYEYGKNLLKV
jgi:2-oxoglutarate ferredoxin oxidoreductase subunit gamma